MQINYIYLTLLFVLAQRWARHTLSCRFMVEWRCNPALLDPLRHTRFGNCIRLGCGSGGSLQRGAAGLCSRLWRDHFRGLDIAEHRHSPKRAQLRGRHSRIVGFGDEDC
jgi:hypothetical protein